MQKYNNRELLLDCYYFLLKYCSRILFKSFKTIDFWWILGTINLSKAIVTVNIAIIFLEKQTIKKNHTTRIDYRTLSNTARK